MVRMQRPPLAWWRLDRLGRAAPAVETVVVRARLFGATVEQAAKALAAAVGARPAQVGPPDLAGASQVGWLEARPDPMGAHESQAGSDPAEVALALARALASGSWVALTLRSPSRAERNRARRWFRAQGVGLSHYSAEAEALVASAWAGAPDTTVLRSLLSQLASALPGFEVQTEAVIGRHRHWLAPAGLGTAGLMGGVLNKHVLLGASAAALGGAWAAALVTGAIPTTERRLRHALAAGCLPNPPRRLLPPRAPKPERRIRGGPGQADRVMAASPGDWPLARRSFLVGPAMAVGVASPHGSAAEPGATRMRPVPATLTADIGPFVGLGPAGEQVHISANPRDIGVAVLGIPGTGKTALVQALWAWACLERARPSGKPGRPGASQALVAFETKEGHPGEWVAWAEAAGVRPLVISLTDTSTPAIDLLAGPGGIAERAARLVNAMIYAFGDQAIQGRSTEALMAALCAAQAATPAALESAGLAGADRLRAAHVLLGGEGDQTAVRLAASLAISDGNVSPDHMDALRRLTVLYGQGMSTTARRALTEAARNKLGLLREAGDWWSSSRRQVTWDDILTHYGVVVLVAPSAKGTLAQTMSAMLAWALRDSIARVCHGWQDQG